MPLLNSDAWIPECATCPKAPSYPPSSLSSLCTTFPSRRPDQSFCVHSILCKYTYGHLAGSNSSGGGSPNATYMEWLATNRMEVDPVKCVLTVVTPFNREFAAQPKVALNGIPILVEDTLHVSGVTLDSGLTFRPHVQEVTASARSRLGVLRAVTGTSFGNSKESVTGNCLV